MGRIEVYNLRMDADPFWTWGIVFAIFMPSVHLPPVIVLRFHPLASLRAIMAIPTSPTSDTTLLDNDSSSVKRSGASTPAALEFALNGDSHNIYPPGREVIFVCKYSHLLSLTFSHFFLPNRWAGHGRNRYSPSQLLKVRNAYIYDQKRSSRSYSISMRSKNTSSSLVGKKFTLLITVWGMSTREPNLLYLVLSLRRP
jgi:hypothetical protein